jgi:hypothetical protein
MEQLILEALERAVADAQPRKLHGTKANPGIFLSSAAPAKAAAQHCLKLGLLEQRGVQKSRSTTVPLYGPSPAGVQYLLEHDPVQQTLAATQSGVESLTRATIDCQQALTHVQQNLTLLREVISAAAARVQPPKVLAPTPSASPPPAGAADGLNALQSELVVYLQQQRRQSPLRPVELPQLLRFARSRHPALTLGQFHDLVRRMAEARQIRLSPFTQAM